MSEITAAISLLVEHGREKEAADFYAAAFGAQKIGDVILDGILMGVNLEIGSLPVTVCGANPDRQANPRLGGPFHPQTAGAVTAVPLLTVSDLEAVFAQACAAGAIIRNAIEQDVAGGCSAALFDPFGHIWSLTERKVDTSRLAAQADHAIVGGSAPMVVTRQIGARRHCNQSTT